MNMPLDSISRIKTNLEKYTTERLTIYGLDTYIISSNHLEEILSILNIHVSALAIWRVANNIQDIEVYPALIFIPYYPENHQWVPALVYKHKGVSYHVQNYNLWVCNACNENNGPVLISMQDVATFYDTDTPVIPTIFHKMTCKKCGKPLAKHGIKYSKK